MSSLIHADLVCLCYSAVKQKFPDLDGENFETSTGVQVQVQQK